jgi:aspartate/methionine/tyrosine aminotransferase
MFSSRLPRLAPNALARALSRARRSGRRLLDLTETNPTAVGLAYPPHLLTPLSSGTGLDYRPEPRGLLEARVAVAGAYGRPHVTVDPAHLILTSGTSEAYGTLFKLLCDPGDEVLVPVPSYPLFDLLTRLEAVRPRPYRLDRLGRWCLDRGSIEDAVTSVTRAILVVSPNNPTGSVVTADDREWLVDYCGPRGIAIISDEVFGDYPLRPGLATSSLAGESRALTFTLGGLSKSVGLPQLKLAWTLVSGPAAVVDDALERLDVICDTYLSVATPVQAAVTELLGAGHALREQIRDRLVGNLATLRAHAAANPEVTLHEPDGGWSAVLRVPAVESEEALVMRLLEESGVVVHPGYFFDFDEEAFLVVSLLPTPHRFDQGVQQLLASVQVAQ